MKLILFTFVILLIKLKECFEIDDVSVSSTELPFLFNSQYGRSNNQTDDIVSTIYSTVASVSKDLDTKVPFNDSFDSAGAIIGKEREANECRGSRSELEFSVRPSYRVCDYLVSRNHSGICSLDLTLISWNGECRDSWLEAGGKLECGMLTGTRRLNFERSSISLRMYSADGVLAVKQVPCSTQVTPPTVFIQNPNVALQPEHHQNPAPYIPPNLRPSTLPPESDHQTFPIAPFLPPTQLESQFLNHKNTIDNEISHNKIDTINVVEIPSTKYPVSIYQPSNKEQSVTGLSRPINHLQLAYPGMRYGPPECDRKTGVVISSPGYPNISPPSECIVIHNPNARLCLPVIYFDYFEVGNMYGSSCRNSLLEIGGYPFCGCLSGMSWRVPNNVFSPDGNLRFRFRGQGRFLITVYYNTCQASYNPYLPNQKQPWRCQPCPAPLPNPQPPTPYPPIQPIPPRPYPRPEPTYPYPPRQPSPQPPFVYPQPQPRPQPPVIYPPQPQPRPQPPVIYPPPPQPRPQPPVVYPPQPPVVYPPQPRPQPPVIYPPQPQPRPQPPVVYPTPQPFPEPRPIRPQPQPPVYPEPNPEPYPPCQVIRVPEGSINCAPIQPQFYCYRFEPPRGYCQMVIRLDEVSMPSSQNCNNEYLTTGIRDPRICQENIPMYIERGGYLQGKLMAGSSVKASFQGLPCSCNVEYRQEDFVLRGTPSQDICQYTIHKYNEGVCSLELTLDTIDLQCGTESLEIDGKSYCGFRANEKLEVPFIEPKMIIQYRRNEQPLKPGSFSINVSQKRRCLQSFSSATGRDIKYKENCDIPLTGVYGTIGFPGTTRDVAQYLSCIYTFQPKQGYCYVRLDFDEVDIPNTLDCYRHYIEINGIKYCGNTLSTSTKVLELDNYRGSTISYSVDRSSKWRFTFSLLPCKQEILARTQGGYKENYFKKYTY